MFRKSNHFGNIDLESCYINTNGTQAGCIMATDAEVRLQFVAYDDDMAAQGGYRYGYYTGQFRLVGTDGNTYVGKFMETFCNSYNYSTAGSSVRDHKGMWDEDPDYIAPELQGIESVQTDDDSATAKKLLIDGQLYILHNGQMYNVQGTLVKWCTMYKCMMFEGCTIYRFAGFPIYAADNRPFQNKRTLRGAFFLPSYINFTSYIVPSYINFTSYIIHRTFLRIFNS